MLIAPEAHAGDPERGHELSVAMAVLLAVVQGATEFLPVSSSGHLALAQAWLGVDPDAAGHRFSILLHGGTLLAVLWLYRVDVVALARVVLRPLRPGHDRTMLVAMFVATLPLGVVLVPGVEPFVVMVEQHPRYVGIALLTTAAILLLGFRGSGAVPEVPDRTPPTLPRAIAIGLAQLIAVLPGISRSGATIGAGVALGLDREQAARFSFLISIPAIGGALAREVVRVLGDSADPAETIPWVAYAAGFLVSFGVGLLCLRLLLRLVRGGKINGFVAYLAVLGLVAVVLG